MFFQIIYSINLMFCFIRILMYQRPYIYGNGGRVSDPSSIYIHRTNDTERHKLNMRWVALSRYNGIRILVFAFLNFLFLSTTYGNAVCMPFLILTSWSVAISCCCCCRRISWILKGKINWHLKLLKINYHTCIDNCVWEKWHYVVPLKMLTFLLIFLQFWEE